MNDPIMRIALLTSAETNHTQEIFIAVKRAKMEPTVCLWNLSPYELSQFDGYVIIDEVPSKYIPLITAVLHEQNETGKPLLGIGSGGTRFLIDTGLVPGLTHYQRAITLAVNDMEPHQTGIRIRLSNDYQYGAFTRRLTPKNILLLSGSHSKERFVIPPALFIEMQINGLDVFYYCDESIRDSANSIAAVSNKSGNILAMLPYPFHTENGDTFFQSMRDYIMAGNYKREAPLYYQPRTDKLIR